MRRSALFAGGNRCRDFLSAAAAVLLWGLSGVAHANDPVAGRIMMKDFNGAEVCLGLMGEPSNEVEVTTVACDTAPTWSILHPTAVGFSIAYGDKPATATYCLDVDTHHPSSGDRVGLWNCGGAGQNQTWAWPTPAGQDLPKGTIKLFYLTPCVAPSPEGQQVFVTTCNPQTQVWEMISPAASPSGYEEFTASGTFTAPKTAVFRVLAIGGGGGGSYDEGAGGGSGLVAYDTVQLNKDDTVTVTVGTGGAGGTRAEPMGGAGTATSFGSHLTARGGNSGQGSNQPGGNGGSGGSGDPDNSGQSQTGGSGGSSGTSSGAGAGTGQGSSFDESFSRIKSVTILSGQGGTTDTANGSGGGGGGGILPAGDTSTGAAANPAGTAHGGKGYGAGGAGGNGLLPAGAKRQGSSGIGGYLIVDWD